MEQSVCHMLLLLLLLLLLMRIAVFAAASAAISPGWLSSPCTTTGS
jgi:hypothetical protein